jgi:Bacterial PH domain
MRMSREIRKRVYRNPSPFVGIAIAVVGDVLIASQIANPNGNSTAAKMLAILFCVGLTVVCLRMAWAAVIASQDGIHVRNVFGSLDVKWGEIERFDIGQIGLLPQVCRIHTNEGRVLRAFGIQDRNIAVTRPKVERPAQKLVAELNKELAARMTEPHVGAPDG